MRSIKGNFIIRKFILLNAEEIQYTACPVCSKPISAWRVKVSDNIKYNIDLCVSCGYAFVNSRPSLQFLVNYYASFGHGHFEVRGEDPNLQMILAKEESEPNSTIDARRLIKTINLLSKNGVEKTFLDVGCGYGFFSKEALEAGFDVVALELAENERGIAKEMTGLTPVASSFEDFECPPGSLGVILMSQILEHALDVNLWIKKSRSLLSNDGVLAIALPNFGSIFRIVMGEDEPYICPPAHLNFFNPKSLSCLLVKHGFKVEQIQWVTRIPLSALAKRVPGSCKPLLPVIDFASSACSRLIDGLQLGLMINVYARKIGV